MTETYDELRSRLNETYDELRSRIWLIQSPTVSGAPDPFASMTRDDLIRQVRFLENDLKFVKQKAARYKRQRDKARRRRR